MAGTVHDQVAKADGLAGSGGVEVGSPAGRSLPDLEPALRNRGSVLVVDDDLDIARAFARWLENGGYQAHIAGGASSALEQIDAHDFEAIVTDINMPELSGLDLLHELRRRGKEVPVIVVTANPSLDTAMRAMDFGAHRYLVKPVKLPALSAAVDAAATLARLARARLAAVELLARQQTTQTQRAELERHFQSALDGLWIAFQPIVDADTRRVIAYEALMRSREPALPHPGAVLGAAEQLQRIHVLGRTTRALTAAALERLPDPLLCFVNLHVLDLTDPQLFDRTAPLSAFASRVVLELTERASGDAITDLRARITRLRAMGFRVAIDDLGAGYAGLQYFTQLAPDFAKIDMSIVRGIDSDPVRQQIMLALVTLCRQLRIDVIAEGIETPEERDTLAGMGCNALQGFHFGRPAGAFAPAAW